MRVLYESDVKQFAINLLEKQGYCHIYPEQQEKERAKVPLKVSPCGFRFFKLCSGKIPQARPVSSR